LEIQKIFCVDAIKNACLKIFLIRNTRNMSEVANRWVLIREKNTAGAFGCGRSEKNSGASESHVLSEKSQNQNLSCQMRAPRSETTR